MATDAHCRRCRRTPPTPHDHVAASTRLNGSRSVLQTAQMNNGSTNFVMKIKSRGHLIRVVQINCGYAHVAKEESTSSELFAEAYLRLVSSKQR